jgi:hypothetical protein
MYVVRGKGRTGLADLEWRSNLDRPLPDLETGRVDPREDRARIVRRRKFRSIDDRANCDMLSD